MSVTEGPYLTGRLLVAMPGIGDPRFERAVVFLCAHNSEHAMGLAVNRPVDGLTVPHLLKRLGVVSSIEVPKDLVLMGGPVERERGFVLHTDDYACADSSIAVTRGVTLTATRDVLEALASHNRRPRRAVMALGYAGWGPGQLEAELRENVWLTCDPDEGLLFDDDHEHKWSRALAKIGISAEHLSAQAGRA
ncbi:MAG TPA: YqgE/AlgH family protein [Caulobacteraceae bacterium]|jgi:putative transcriptional regulator|nr:YqgE/AlgH family protein [Caulobacteraceae bacterium]